MKRSGKRSGGVIFVVPRFQEHLGVGLLDAYLRRKGFRNTACVSANLREVERALKCLPGSILALYAPSPCFQSMIFLVRQLRRRGASFFSVFGGPHVTFVPETLQIDGVDAICRGESEEAFANFVEAFDFRHGRPRLDMPNFGVKDVKGVVYENALKPFEENLDQLSFVRRDLFVDSIHFRVGLRKFIFSRGCDQACFFCSTPGYRKLYEAKAGTYYRVFSARRAVEETRDVLTRFGGVFFHFHDSIFSRDQEWLNEFAHDYKKINVPFTCNSSVSRVSRDYAMKLKEAGCYTVLLGLESVSGRVRNELLGKSETEEDVVSAVRYLREAGLRVGFFNILGSPGATIKDDLKTLLFNQTSGVSFADVACFSFLPGSRIFDKERGRNLSDKRFASQRIGYNYVYSNRLADPGFRKFSNLCRLFPLFVYWKIPLSIVSFLIRLPFGKFYQMIMMAAFLFHSRRVHKVRMIGFRWFF